MGVIVIAMETRIIMAVMLGTKILKIVRITTIIMLIQDLIRNLASIRSQLKIK